MMPSSLLLRGAALTLSLALVAGCATNPVSKKSEFVLMSEKEEIELGRRAAVMVARQLPLLPRNDPLSRYVDRVGQRIATVSDRSELFYRFHVVDSKTINAFALPGGYIYIYRGLLAHLNSEAELAAVLGHEIGHVTARHAVQRYTKAKSYELGMAIASIFVPVPQAVGSLADMVAVAIIQGYGREAELQSDELSLRYIRKAGYDVRATIHLLSMLERLDIITAKEKRDVGEKVRKYHGAFSSHPETKKRIQQAVAKAAALQTEGGRVGHLPMLRALKGYPYGDNPDEGAVIGNRFIHPGLGIQLAFTKRWVIKNTRQALTARVRRQKIYFQLTTVALHKREPAAVIFRGLFPRRRTGPVSSGIRNGYPYAHAIINMSAPHVSRARIHATLLLDGPRAYLMLMWSGRKTFADNRADFETIAASFRRYDVKADGDVPRIYLYAWKKGDTWKKLARKSRFILGRFTADRLAALNGMGVDELPHAGRLIKLVH